MTAVASFCAPAYEHVPAHVGTYGPEVADLADSVGMTLDPEQRLLIDAMYAYDARGRLVAPEVGCAAPRQNIKSHVGKAAALADLVLFHEPNCLWTAHLRATSDDIFSNPSGTGLAQLFENYDFLRRLLDSEPKDSDGEQSITLRPRAAGEPRAKIGFMARSERGGRGLSGRKVTFDEALFLKPSMLSAMIPILSAQSISGAVQVRYLGSAGLLQSAVWREIRDRGRRGDALRLAWLEWAAPVTPCELERCPHAVGTPGCALDRPELVRAANLAIDRRMDIDFVLGTERLAMTAEDYMCERLGWWQDPPNAGSGDLDVQAWRDLTDLLERPRVPLVFGVDVGEDRTASIGAAWRRPDGVQVMVSVDEADRVDVGLSPAQVTPRLVELCQRWSGRVALGGPSAALDADLRRAGLQVDVVTASDFATACGAFEDHLRAGTIHHGNQPELNDSVGGAKWRKVGTAGEQAWQLREAAGIGPLAAVTRALSSLQSRPEHVLEPVAIPAAAEATGIAAMTF